MKISHHAMPGRAVAIAGLGTLLTAALWWGLAGQFSYAQHGRSIGSAEPGASQPISVDRANPSSDGQRIIHLESRRDLPGAALSSGPDESRGDPRINADYRRWREGMRERGDRSNWEHRTLPRHDDPYLHRRPPRNYYYFGSRYYPLLDCDRFYYPGGVVVIEEDSGWPAQPPTATYEIVKPDQGQWIEGHWEEVAMQDVIEGEYVEVYHPAVYRKGDDGNLALVEKDRTTREPKVRIILTRVWVEGHWELADENVPMTRTD